MNPLTWFDKKLELKIRATDSEFAEHGPHVRVLEAIHTMLIAHYIFNPVIHEDLKNFPANIDPEEVTDLEGSLHARGPVVAHLIMWMAATFSPEDYGLEESPHYNWMIHVMMSSIMPLTDYMWLSDMAEGFESLEVLKHSLTTTEKIALKGRLMEMYEMVNLEKRNLKYKEAWKSKFVASFEEERKRRFTKVLLEMY